MKLDSRYAEYFPEYSNYIRIALRLLKYMYVMNNSGKLFADEFTDWLINKAGLKQSQYQISIYYKYALYLTKIIVLVYVYDCVYWYTPEAIVKWSV